MEYIRKILASNLLELRKSKGSTQAKIAEEVGATVASYNRWENGINWPDPESIEKIANYYSIPSSRLFQDKSLQTPPASPDYLKDSLLKEVESVLNKYKP